MGKTIKNVPIVQAPENNTPPPVVNPRVDPYHALLMMYMSKIVLVAFNHVTTALEYHLFPEIRVAPHFGPNMLRPVRGRQRALFVVPPPLLLLHNLPNQCPRRLVFVISVFWSSAVLIWLSKLIGPANLASSVTPVDLPLHLSRVLDVVNQHAGHVSGNVAVANQGVCLLQAGLGLVQTCEANLDTLSSALAAMT